MNLDTPLGIVELQKKVNDSMNQSSKEKWVRFGDCILSQDNLTE